MNNSSGRGRFSGRMSIILSDLGIQRISLKFIKVLDELLVIIVYVNFRENK